jgi:hypothetical protein
VGSALGFGGGFAVGGGVGRGGVAAGVAFGGVAAGVEFGDVAAGVEFGPGALGVGAGAVEVGDGVGAAVGTDWGGLGRSTTAVPSLAVGKGEGPGDADGLGEGAGDGLIDCAGPGPRLGRDPDGWTDGPEVTAGLGLPAAMPSGGTRGAASPTAKATVARSKLRTPRATTSRAR